MVRPDLDEVGTGAAEDVVVDVVGVERKGFLTSRFLLVDF